MQDILLCKKELRRLTEMNNKLLMAYFEQSCMSVACTSLMAVRTFSRLPVVLYSAKFSLFPDKLTKLTYERVSFEFSKVNFSLQFGIFQVFLLLERE